MPLPIREIKQLRGIMNTDSSNETILPFHHKMAKNILFRNNKAQRIPGTTEISFTKPAGTNECVGAFYFEQGAKIIWCNWNSNTNHGIYQYDLRTKTATHLILEGTNAESGVLNFDRNYPIYAMRVLQGDTTQGNELWFLNSQKQPCKFSIERALSGSYGTIKRSYLSVNFSPPIMPPSCTYENDATVTVNNLRKRLFRFKLRYVNTQRNKSVTSSQAELQLPVNYIDTAIDKDPTKNSRIAIVYPTGNAEVKKIELLMSQNSGNGWEDYVLIKTIDKAAESIGNDDISIYRFYNNESYVTIDPKESIQVFDLVPLEASDIELLNGNVPIYCNIKEYYDPITVTGSVTSGYTPQTTTQPPFVFKAVQGGDSAFGTGNIHIVLVGTIAIGNVFNIYTTSGTISFTATAATTANVITGLSAAAVTAGFTVVSSDSENLVISKTNEVLQRTGTSVTLSVTNSFVYDWNSRYAFSLQYFDENGVTIGSQRDATFTVQTVNYTETGGVPNIPKITLEITNRPPLEAKYFTIGRSKNLTKLRHLYWVSARTFKDNEYAYIDIENLNNFIKKNPTSSHLAYSFSPSDRIRFIKKISGTSQLYTDNDFEIQSEKINPIVNGVEQTGQFLKILLPTTGTTFDFGTAEYFNYYIQIYTPALSVSPEYNLYTEFGERYTIGNPGTATRYHQGGTQNQTSNLSQPAIFEFIQGDDYYRNRDINTGGDLNYDITAGSISAGRHTLGVPFVDRTFTDANITTGSSPLQGLSGWTYASDTRALIKMGVSAPLTTFKAKGTIVINAADDDTFVYFFQDKYGNIRYCNSVRGISAGVQTIAIDCSFQLDASNHISLLGWSESDYASNKDYSTTELTISIDNINTLPIIDKNFSDYFASAVNSNGRSFNVDPNRRQSTYKNLFRWGLSRDFDTNLNRTNRFYEQNATEADLSYGAVQRMIARGDTMRFFQESGVGWVGIYKRIISNAEGANTLATTDEIITKNNKTYFIGRYGVGNHPTSLVSSKSRDFFIDPIRGYQCMVGESGGIEPISEQNFGAYYIQPLFPPYTKDYLRSNGTRAKIMGWYDYGEDLYFTVLQGGTLATFPTIDDYCFAYRDEPRNTGYTSFFDLTPEWALSAEDVTYLWKNGSLYSLNNVSAYGSFFGTGYASSLRLVFNDNMAVKKQFLTSAYQSDGLWSSDRLAISNASADSIITSFFNPDTGLQQISELKSVDYSNEEGKKCAALLKDKNSGLDPTLAVLEGDNLQGYWIEIEYLCSGNSSQWIYLPEVSWIPSNRV